MEPRSGSSRGEPRRLAQALSDLIALRGYARAQGDAQLQQAWAQVVGPQIARLTRATAVRRGVLQVSVASAPLLSQLAGFHRVEFLEQLRERHAQLNIRDLKFRLDSDVGRRRSHSDRPDD